MTMLDQVYREFDCPACVPMVPYRQVRALKVVSEYDAERARKFQEPITKRSLAAAFGALVEKVETDAPPLSNKLTRQLRERGEPWDGPPMEPPPVAFRRSRSTAEKIRAVREDREGARDRFSGLELYDEEEFR